MRLDPSDPPRRPWLLIATSGLLAVLSGVLWIQWADSRALAERLQAEIKLVYGEGEALRTKMERAQERVSQLEQELRERAPSSPQPAAASRNPQPR